MNDSNKAYVVVCSYPGKFGLKGGLVDSAHCWDKADTIMARILLGIEDRETRLLKSLIQKHYAPKSQEGR